MVQLHFNHMSHLPNDYEKKMKLEVLDQESAGNTRILCSKKLRILGSRMIVPHHV